MSATETPTTPIRPLSGTEQSWYQAVPTGTGITVISLQFSSPIPPETLQSALTKLLNYHPTLSSTLTPTSILPSPLPPLQTLNLPNPNLHSVVELEMNRNPWTEPDRTAEPTLFATLYNETILVLRIHAAICDRTALAEAAEELVAILAGREEEVEERIRVMRKGILGIEEMIRKEDSWKPFWARGRDLVGYSVNGLRSSTLAFYDAGSDRRSEMVRMVLEEDATRRLLDACKTKGVKLCGAIAAATLIATYSSKRLEINQSETYSMLTLIDCRKFLDPVLTKKDVGFYHSGVLNTHSVNGTETLWVLATRIHDAYATAVANKKHLTDIGELNYLMCKAIENPHLTPSSSLRTALVTIFEEPLVSETSEIHRKIGVVDYLGCASVHGVGPSIAVFDAVRDGKLDCAFVYPAPLHSREQMAEIVEHLERLLVEASCEDDN